LIRPSRPINDKASDAPLLPGRGPARSAGLSLRCLVVATFFMVSGGAYGTEDIVRSGYKLAILVLIVTPLLWSLPTALMIGELSAAMPREGGYYAWVRRALGPCWGFQEAWLSLAASVFDMAIYPTLFVAYLVRLFPWFAAGHRGMVVGVALVALCALMNLAGIRVVADSSLWLFALLSAPFAIMVIVAPLKHGLLAHAATPATTDLGVMAGLAVAMWNYMGWDNASTIAVEVRRPQRTYPRAMLAAVAVVTLSYVLPVAAMWWTGAPPAAFSTGSWAELAGLLAGRWLQVWLVVGGMMSAFGMFNALVLSYSRVPLAMAIDGLLPSCFARTDRRTGAPWISIVVLALGWALCVGLGFERLVTLDVMLYGAALALEFVSLAVLRVTAPTLPRPFRVPGGLAGAIAVGVPPLLLLGLAVWSGGSEHILGMNALLFGGVIIVVGFIAYGLQSLVGKRLSAAPELAVDAAENLTQD
jgi:amino acid transporter